MKTTLNGIGTESGNTESPGAEIRVIGTQSVDSDTETSDASCVAAVPDKVKARWRRLNESAKAEEKRRLEFKTWLERGSDDLRDAWVSVCSCADTNVVQAFKLVEVVESIRLGRISVRNRWHETQEVDLGGMQQEVRRLYADGVAEAQALNNATLRKIVEALDLNV